MERGKLCGAVFLDLSKTFDTVDHTILLRKLSSFGVTSDTAKWFESYLNGRMQCTSCGPELSDLLPERMACLRAAYWALCYFLFI